MAAAGERGTRAEQVMQVEKELFELYADPQLNTKPEQLSFRGGSFYSEVALELIRAIHNNLGTQLVVNTANRGAIHGLPDDAVIEINCIVDAQGAHPLTFGPLPEPMQAPDAAGESLRTSNHRSRGARRSPQRVAGADRQPVSGQRQPGAAAAGRGVDDKRAVFAAVQVSGYTQPDRGSARRTHFFSRNSGVGRW